MYHIFTLRNLVKIAFGGENHLLAGDFLTGFEFWSPLTDLSPPTLLSNNCCVVVFSHFICFEFEQEASFWRRAFNSFVL